MPEQKQTPSPEAKTTPKKAPVRATPDTSTGLYTFILEYRGGTYICQHKASTPTEALSLWVEQLDIGAISKMREKHRAKIRQEFEEFGYVAVDDTIHVWCRTFFIKRHYGLLNFVLTRQA